MDTNPATTSALTDPTPTTAARMFPESMPNIARVAQALANTSRAAMCAALMNGLAWTVGELARYAGLARSTASEHVSILVGCGIAREVRQGRHRYVLLAGEQAAQVIESLGILSNAELPAPPSLRATRLSAQAREGRTCYRHLAGRLGVRLTEALQARGLIDKHFQPTATGHAMFESWGVPTDQLSSAAPCLDTTERQFHIAGPLGTGLCQTFMRNGWVERVGGTSRVEETDSSAEVVVTSPRSLTRAVRLTAVGRARLKL